MAYSQDLFIKQQALMAYYRTTGFSKFTVEQIKCRDAPTLVGHREYLRQFENKLEFTRPESDDIPIVSNWNKQYTLDEASFGHGIPHDDAQINIYTDGSKVTDGHTGAGLVIKHGQENELVQQHFYLGTHTTVFQGEVYAIYKALQLLSADKYHGQTVVINSDSRAALLALNKRTIKSRLVSNTIELLNGLVQRGNKIVLRWCKAHVGHELNELVDGQAKAGALDIDNPAPDTPLMSGHIIKGLLRKSVIKIWDRRWKASPACRQTKLFFPSIDKSLSQKLLTSNRHHFGMLVRVITGHCFLRRHNTLVELGEDDIFESICRFCSENEETPFHFLVDCPMFVNERNATFGTYHLYHPFTNMSQKNLMSFLRDIQYEVIEDPE